MISGLPRSSPFRPGRFAASGKRSAGFTIVELMVAAAITLVVLGLMIQVTFTVLKTFDQVTGTLTLKNQAETALDYIKRDFQSIVWRRDQNVWLLATIQPDQVNTGDANVGDAEWNPTVSKPGSANAGQPYSSLNLTDPANPNRIPEPFEYRFGEAGVWLRFFSLQSTDSGLQPLSAPAAVSYQIVRMKPRPNSSEYRYQFFRSVVRPNPVGPAANDLRSVLTTGYNINDPLYTNNTGGNTNGLPESVRKPDREVLLANNVIDFGVRFWQKDPATGALVLIFPANAANNPSNNNLGFAISGQAIAPNAIAFGGLAAGQLNIGYPDFVDVILRVLTDEGGARDRGV